MATKLKVNKMGYVLAYNECKGSVQCKTDLPTDATKGDVYNVLDEDGTYYHYDGSSWSCCECELEIEGGGGGSVSPDLSEINEALDNALYKANQGESVEIEGDIIEYALKSELDEVNNNLVKSSITIGTNERMKIHLRKQGKLVVLECEGNSAVADLTAYTIPTEYRPQYNLQFPCIYSTVSWTRYVGLLQITVDGKINVFSIADNTHQLVVQTEGFINTTCSWFVA